VAGREDGGVPAADLPSAEATRLLGLLADDRRLRVVAAVVLGASTQGAVVERSGLAATEVRRAVDRLQRAGLVEVADGRLTFAADRLRDVVRSAARAADALAVTPEALGATADQVPVLRNFLRDGRLVRIPAAAGKRRVVLEFLAMQFEPGRIYPERDVNILLSAYNPDYAALRRYLVDDELLERREGFYWRAGGPIDLDAPEW